MISEKTRTIVIYTVLTVWAINFFAPFVFKDYQPSEMINGIFMTIVGGALMIRSKSNDDKEDEDVRVSDS